MLETSKPLKIAKNTLFLNTSTVLTRGLSFITSILLARYLGQLGFGQYTFALYFTGLFIVISELGIGYLTIREVAIDKSMASKYLGHNMIIRTVLGVITFILILLAINIMHYPPLIKAIVCVLAFYAIGKSFAGSFNSIFLAFERMGFVSLLNIVLTSLILGGILFGISLKYSLIKLLLVYPAAVIIYLGLAFILIIKKFVKPNFKFNFQFTKNLVKDSIPFALSGIFLTISTQIDMTILKNIQGDIATGYYGVSRAFISALLFIPANFIIVLYPVFSRLYKSSRDYLIKTYQRSVSLLLILALPIATGGTILAERLIRLFYGPQYLPAAISLQVLCWTVAVQFIGSPITILMLAINRQKTMAWVSFWFMLLIITLNLILIPQFSYLGASISFLITDLLAFITLFIIVFQSGYRLNLLKLAARPILATLLMGIFVYLWRDKNLALVVFMSCGLYLILLFSLKVIGQEEIKLFKQLFKRGNLEDGN